MASFTGPAFGGAGWGARRYLKNAPVSISAVSTGPSDLHVVNGQAGSSFVAIIIAARPPTLAVGMPSLALLRSRRGRPHSRSDCLGTPVRTTGRPGHWPGPDPATGDDRGHRGRAASLGSGPRYLPPVPQCPVESGPVKRHGHRGLSRPSTPLARRGRTAVELQVNHDAGAGGTPTGASIVQAAIRAVAEAAGKRPARFPDGSADSTNDTNVSERLVYLQSSSVRVSGERTCPAPLS